MTSQRPGLPELAMLQEVINERLRCLQQPLICCHIHVRSMPLQQVAANALQVSLHMEG